MPTIKTLKYLSLLILAILAGCSQINKASDFITNPTAKQKYQRDFDISDELYSLWESQADSALQDSISIDLPYSEQGKFKPREFSVYAYEISLKPGEILEVETQTDSVKNLVFIDLFQQKNDSVFENIQSSNFQKNQLAFEPVEKGTYKLLIQPEIEAHTTFRFHIKKRPAYIFPVAATRNEAIQSYWGAAREGGARSHEGIDIFADRGTPVLAATNGRITYKGEKGLGGKQVWLRDRKRKQSLYYAHLDSIHPISGSVNVGDTLGYVGNTGNAKTTPPHLHFGIYKSYRGAINPLSFVFQIPDIEKSEIIQTDFPDKLSITSVKANLRNKPGTTDSKILKTLTNKDTLNFLGKAGKWYHIKNAEKRAYIHQSLVKAL